MSLFNQNFLTWSNPSINRGIQPTYSYDFSSDPSELNQHAANISVDHTTNFRWDFDIKNDSTNDASSIALGANLSNTEWICDFDLTYTTLTPVSGTTTTFFVLSDSDSGTDSQTSQDALGCRINFGASDSISNIESDGTSLPGGASDAFSTLTTVTTTTYYVRFIRESATSFKNAFYSDSDRTSETDSVTSTIASTIQNLDEFKIANYSGGGGGSDTIIGYIDNLKIWDDISSF